jgi:hypothetical protein
VEYSRHLLVLVWSYIFENIFLFHRCPSLQNSVIRRKK